MKIEYFDSGEDKEFILGNEEKYNIYKSKNIKIIFQSNEIKKNSPFSVKISDTLSSFNIIIIFIICFCAFLIIIIVIICFKYIKKRRNMRNINIIINNNFQRDIIISSNLYNTERNELINYIKQLKKVKYKEIKDKALNNKCPFEMEIFDDNSEVILTSCHHSIHYDCLNVFIDRNNNLKEFKCFLCNNSLYKCQDDKINIAKN